MKLYTEEQVIQMITSSYLHGVERAHDYKDVKEHILKSVTPIKLQSVTPIELPSDEELEKMRKEYIEHINTIVHRDLERDGYLDLGFLAGAKNIIDKIQGDNK